MKSFSIQLNAFIILHVTYFTQIQVSSKFITTDQVNLVTSQVDQH